MTAVPDAVLDAIRTACAELDAGHVELLHRALYVVGAEKRRAELEAFRAALRPGSNAILDHALSGGETRGRTKRRWYVPAGTEITVRRRHASKPYHLIVASVGPYVFAERNITNVGHTGEHWVETRSLLPVDSDEARRRRDVAPVEAMLHQMIGAVR